MICFQCDDFSIKHVNYTNFSVYGRGIIKILLLIYLSSSIREYFIFDTLTISVYYTNLSCVYMYICVYVSACIYVYMHICMCVSMCTCAYVCICVFVCVYMCVCLYAYLLVYEECIHWLSDLFYKIPLKYIIYNIL